MLNKKVFIVSIVLLVQTVFIACRQAPPFECMDEIGCITIQPDEPIKIGVLQALSGGAATFGTTQANSIELAVEDRESEMLGHAIELQVEDSLCTTEGGANMALKIVADPQIIGILGPSCSGAAVEVSKIMSEAGLVMVASSTSAPALTSVGGEQGADWQPGYFRTIANDALLGDIVAQFALEELALTKAAVLDDGDAYTQALAASFAQSFDEQGGEVVLSVTVNKGDEDMVPYLTAVANSEAELLFFPIFSPEGDLIVQQVKEVPELGGMVLIGGAALITDAFVKSVGDDGAGMFFVSVAPSVGTAHDELGASYEANFGEAPPSHTYAFAYDATNLLLSAIEQVAVTEDDGTVHIGRQALRDALYSATLDGAAGTLQCDNFGDCFTPSFNVVQLEASTSDVEDLRENIIYASGLGK